MPRRYGFFPAVVPGTQFVTLGGAIANDVHGKNHHRRGTFGCHVESLHAAALGRHGPTLLGRPTMPRLFAATIGGMGLTGLILSASIRLMRVPSLDIVEKVTPFRDLGEFFDLAEAADQANEYAVAWIDQLAGGQRPRARPAADRQPCRAWLACGGARRRRGLSVPFQPPFNVLNRPFLKPSTPPTAGRRARDTAAAPDRLPGLFLSARRRRATGTGSMGRTGSSSTRAWCRKTPRAQTVPALLDAARRAGQGSFLTVLKRFGSIRSPGLLSFPRPGYTLTLDFPNRGEATLDAARRTRPHHGRGRRRGQSVQGCAHGRRYLRRLLPGLAAAGSAARPGLHVRFLGAHGAAARHATSGHVEAAE